MSYFILIFSVVPVAHTKEPKIYQRGQNRATPHQDRWQELMERIMVFEWDISHGGATVMWTVPPESQVHHPHMTPYWWTWGHVEPARVAK